MIYTRTNNYGIDAKIKRIQTELDSRLNWNDLNIYGRLYVDQLSDGDGVKGLRPNWHEGGGDYRPVFLNDGESATVGFVVLSHDIEPLAAVVDVIFTVNLDEIYTEQGREDEKARLDALWSLQKCGFIQDITDVKIGVESVFSGMYIDDYKFRDMQPFYNFSFTCVIPYADKRCHD